MKKLNKNKIYAILLILIGLITVPITSDITFLVFAVLLGVLLFRETEEVIG